MAPCHYAGYRYIGVLQAEATVSAPLRRQDVFLAAVEMGDLYGGTLLKVNLILRQNGTFLLYLDFTMML